MNTQAPPLTRTPRQQAMIAHYERTRQAWRDAFPAAAQKAELNGEPAVISQDLQQLLIELLFMNEQLPDNYPGKL